MADFQPRFVDLVRNYTTTTGTANFVVGVAVNGFSSFSSALQPGDSFYYSALGIDKPLEREVGRGTMQADGTISRDPISGIATNFSNGIKSLSLIAAAEWFNGIQALASGASGGSGGGQASADSRGALAATADTQQSVILTEAGREGLFVFDGSNLAAKVAADPYQGIYVVPSSDTTGASGAWVRRFTGPICLEWFGVAEGASSNAARVESAISLVNPARGNWLLFPYGNVAMDDTVQVMKPCRIEGHGMGTGSSGGNTTSGSTLLIFPAGKTGFQLRHSPADGGAQQTHISNLRIAAAAINGTAGVASYDPTPATTPALHTITLSSGASNFADGDVIALAGANCQLIVPDRLFTTTAGSNVITFTSGDSKYRGNAVGYVGQTIEVLGAGFPAGTVITAWSPTSITVSGNAANSLTTQYCYLYGPLIAQVVAGGGTGALTIDSYGNNPRKVTNATIRHVEPGIYATVQHHMTNVEVMGFLAGSILHGNTETGDVADNCLYTNCTFNSSRDVTAPAGFGVVLEGYDAQVNTFVGCNFAGNSCGVLDMGYLGSDFVGCHWAFNNGIQVHSGGSQTKILGGYMESGTSYLATMGGSASFFATVSMIPGQGFSGIQPSGGVTTVGSFEALGGAKIAGAIVGNGVYQTIEAPGGNGVPGFTLPTNSITKQWTGSAHWWFTSNPGNVPWRLDGGPLELWHNAAGTARTSASGFDLYGGKTYSVGGTQVVGARIVGWMAASGTASRGAFAAAAAGTASASYVQSELQGALDRIAALEARIVAYDADLRAHGLIGS